MKDIGPLLELYFNPDFAGFLILKI